MTTSALVMDDKRPLLERVREFLCNVNAKVPVDKVLLFGSTAKRKRHGRSDVDLIIVSKGFSAVHELERTGMLLDLWPYVEELEILAYTPEEFSQVKDRFMMKKILAYAVDLTPKENVACP
jgi:predicted nucleotidyltransferase